MMVDTLSWYLITAMSAAYAILDSYIKKVYEYLKQTLQSVGLYQVLCLSAVNAYLRPSNSNFLKA